MSDEPWVTTNFSSLLEIKSTEVINLLKSLINIRSYFGEEHEISNFLKEYLESKKLTVEVQNLSGNRKNIYAYYGSNRNTRIVLTAHMDTVRSWVPLKVKGNDIYGRGACDDKGSVAGQIVAFLELLDEGFVQEGDVSLLFVVGEEYNGIGMIEAVKHLNVKWDVAICGEPTENKLAVGHKGNYNFKVNVAGVDAHSGYPHLGVDANKILIRKLAKIMDYTSFPYSNILGPTTVNVGLIQGGVAQNIISPRAFCHIYIRVAEDLQKCDEIVKAIFLSDENNYERITLETIQYLPPVVLECDVPGFEKTIIAYCTDAPYLTNAKKRYLYGPGSIKYAHRPDEHVSIDQMYSCVEGYKTIVKHNL